MHQRINASTHQRIIPHPNINRTTPAMPAYHTYTGSAAASISKYVSLIFIGGVLVKRESNAMDANATCILLYDYEGAVDQRKEIERIRRCWKGKKDGICEGGPRIYGYIWLRTREEDIIAKQMLPLGIF